MGVLLVGHAQNTDDRARRRATARVHEVAATPSRADGGCCAARPQITLASVPCASRQPLHGREIALEIAAGDAEAGREIGVRPDAAVELQRRHDLRPVGADLLAHLRQRIGDADRGHEAAS